MKLKKNDTVKVMSGDQVNKTGVVVKVNEIANTVIIQGVNMVKKAKKQRKQNEKGGIIEVEAPINASKVQILCKKCGPTRVSIKNDGSSKKRTCAKCGEVL